MKRTGTFQRVLGMYLEFPESAGGAVVSLEKKACFRSKGENVFRQLTLSLHYVPDLKKTTQFKVTLGA